MPARGLLTWVLAAGEAVVDELAVAARCDADQVRRWLGELLEHGYGVEIEGVVVVSDDPVDLGVGADHDDGDVDSGPGLVWQALKEAQEKRGGESGGPRQLLAETVPTSVETPVEVSVEDGEKAADVVGWHRDRIGTPGHGVMLEEPGECVICGQGTDTAFEGTACHVPCFWASTPLQRRSPDSEEG